MSLTHHRWLWLLATALAVALAAASLAATTALASEPDEDDEDDENAPAQVLPTPPLPAAPAPVTAPPSAAPSPVAAAPVVRSEHRSFSLPTRPQRRVDSRVAVRPVAHVVQTGRRHRTGGIAVRTVPRGGVQAGAGGMAPGR
ncbi:MAG TPA: hypothetical protein VKB28_06195 [Solirubrobacteraceae bacterium]|nr:hypothetical protein [Solirubrobacteraceae bacterium]